MINHDKQIVTSSEMEEAEGRRLGGTFSLTDFVLDFADLVP